MGAAPTSPAGVYVGAKGLLGLGKGAANFLNPQFNPPQVPGLPPPPPEIDPRMAQLRDRQLMLAKNFQASAPRMQSTMESQAQDQARLGLADTQKGIRSNFNDRGLLYGGGVKAAQAGAGAQAASALAAKRAQIAEQVRGKQEGMEADALQTGLGIQGMEQARQDQIYKDIVNRQDQIYKDKLQARQEQMAYKNSPIGLLGSGLNTIFGS